MKEKNDLEKKWKQSGKEGVENEQDSNYLGAERLFLILSFWV